MVQVPQCSPSGFYSHCSSHCLDGQTFGEWTFNDMLCDPWLDDLTTRLGLPLNKNLVLGKNRNGGKCSGNVEAYQFQFILQWERVSNAGKSQALASSLSNVFATYMCSMAHPTSCSCSHWGEAIHQLMIIGSVLCLCFSQHLHQQVELWGTFVLLHLPREMCFLLLSSIAFLGFHSHIAGS